MTPLPPELEALMPEPVATVDVVDVDGFLLVPCSDHMSTHANFFTTDQVRHVMLGVREWAAKKCEEAETGEVIDDGDRLFNFAIRHCAAAIRGGGQG